MAQNDGGAALDPHEREWCRRALGGKWLMQHGLSKREWYAGLAACSIGLVADLSSMPATTGPMHRPNKHSN